MDFKFPKVNSSFVLPKTAVMAKADMHFIILFCILIVGLAVGDYCRVRAQAKAAKAAKEARAKAKAEVRDNRARAATATRACCASAPARTGCRRTSARPPRRWWKTPACWADRKSVV